MAWKPPGLKPAVSDTSGWKPPNLEPVEEVTSTEVPSTYTGKKPAGVLENLFPSTVQTWREAEAPLAKGAAALATPMTLLGDVLGIPARGVATLRGEKMADPSAAVFRPEIEATKEFARKVFPESRIENYEGLGPVYSGGVPEGEIEIAGQMASDPINWLTGLTKAAKPATTAARKAMAWGQEGLTGVPQKAMLKGGEVGVGALKESLKESIPRAKDFLTKMHKFNAYTPEATMVDDMAKSGAIKPIKPDKLFNVMGQHAVESAVPQLDVVKKSIDEIQSRMTAKMLPDGTIPGAEYLKIRRDLDKAINWNAPDAGLLGEAYKDLRGVMKDDLIQASPKEYKKIMESWSDKLDALEDVTHLLHGDQEQALVRLYQKATLPANQPMYDAVKKLEEIMQPPKNRPAWADPLLNEFNKARLKYPGYEDISGDEWSKAYLRMNAQREAAKALGPANYTPQMDLQRAAVGFGPEGTPGLLTRKGTGQTLAPLLLGAAGFGAAGPGGMTAALGASPLAQYLAQRGLYKVGQAGEALGQFAPQALDVASSGSLERAVERWLQENENQ